MMQRTPWAQWIRAAARMGVSPEAFWRLSLKEWRALTTLGAAANAMTRTTLDELMARVEGRRQDGGVGRPDDRSGY